MHDSSADAVCKPKSIRSAPTAGTTVAVTCAGDGRCHRITETAYAAGLACSSGRFLAVCGRVVLAASLSRLPGPPCRACAADMAQLPVAAIPRRQRRPTAFVAALLGIVGRRA